ncbi:S24 family peptidase [Komagataeibacter oboediens]|uniref:S24 family peptidase n=1 Tax=Komagataeibacter oboediens TaxID=65958 RepID=UPI0020C36C52|nr:S24 family peptidase [Komagataeibacter oboediens]
MVDTAGQPQSGCMVVARWQDQTIICEVTRQRGSWWLRSGKGQDAQLRELAPEQDAEVWAVVSTLVRTPV